MGDVVVTFDERIAAIRERAAYGAGSKYRITENWARVTGDVRFLLCAVETLKERVEETHNWALHEDGGYHITCSSCTALASLEKTADKK